MSPSFHDKHPRKEATQESIATYIVYLKGTYPKHPRSTFVAIMLNSTTCHPRENPVERPAAIKLLLQTSVPVNPLDKQKCVATVRGLYRRL